MTLLQEKHFVSMGQPQQLILQPCIFLYHLVTSNILEILPICCSLPEIKKNNCFHLIEIMGYIGYNSISPFFEMQDVIQIEMSITIEFLYFLQVVNLNGFQNFPIQIGCDIIYYIRGLRMNLVRDKNHNRDMKIHSYFVLFVFHLKLSIFIMRHEVFSTFYEENIFSHNNEK